MSEVKKLITKYINLNQCYLLRTDVISKLEQAHASDVAELNKRIDADVDKNLEYIRNCDIAALRLSRNQENKGLKRAKQLIKEVLGGVE